MLSRMATKIHNMNMAALSRDMFLLMILDRSELICKDFLLRRYLYQDGSVIMAVFQREVIQRRGVPYVFEMSST